MAHFLIDGLVLRWIVTVLFGIGIAGYAYILVADHERWICTVNHLLHQVMSVAMIAMVWPVGMRLPTFGPMVFFLLAAAWFVVLAWRGSSGIADRMTNGYYAAMMVAMAWMYAVMNGKLLGQNGQHARGHTGTGSPGLDPFGTTLQSGLVTTVNGIAAAGFAVAAAYWLYRFIADRRGTLPHTAPLANLGSLCQAAMAAGIAVMFA